jgi:hypothetical protein
METQKHDAMVRQMPAPPRHAASPAAEITAAEPTSDDALAFAAVTRLRVAQRSGPACSAGWHFSLG